MKRKCILSKASGSMVYLTESALLTQKIEEVSIHLLMEYYTEDQYGGKIKKLDQGHLENFRIEENQKEYFEYIMVTIKNAM